MATCLNCSTEFTPKRKEHTGLYCSRLCYRAYTSQRAQDPEYQRERLMRRVNSSGGPDACWPFTGFVEKRNGYGMVVWNGRSAYASRAVYIAFNGELTSDVEVRHTCDNPVCCNPRHLISGSHLDNINDMIERGRKAVPLGESHHNSKLTEDDVRYIRKMYEWRHPEYGQVALAKKFGVAQPTIWHVLVGDNWTHVK